MFYKKGVLKNFVNQKKAPALQSLFKQLQAFKLYQKVTLARCFPVNFVKFLRTTFLKNISGDCFWKIVKLGLSPSIKNILLASMKALLN